jgi:6-phosphogluconolactonase
MSELERFADRDALADAAATAIAYALGPAGPASLIVTGGTTPGPTYDRLARLDIEWARVSLTLTDERFVDASSDESNEHLVRKRLLVHQAAAAKLIPLKASGPTPEDDARTAEARVRALLPTAAVLLGMGSDGHIASLFPGAPDLAANLDPAGDRLCVGVAMSGEKPMVARISLTVRALLDTAVVIVLISGEEKLKVIERIAADEAYAPPAAAILRQLHTPVRILWAP